MTEKDLEAGQVAEHIDRPEYQPKTGAPCGCRRGVQRDNCPACEGTGQRIDFRAIRAHRLEYQPAPPRACEQCGREMRPSFSAFLCADCLRTAGER